MALRLPFRKARQSVDVAVATGIGFHTLPQWPEDNYESYAREGYGRNELAFACINEIATSASEVRLRVMSEGRGRSGQAEEVTGTPYARLLANPNPEQSQFEWLELLHTYLQIAGNNYVFKLRGGARQVVALYNLRPDRMQVVPGGGGVAGYVYTLEGQPYFVQAADIIHIKRANPFDDFYGLSPFHVLARVANLDTDMTGFAKVFFQNAGVPAGFLKLKRKLQSQDEANRIKSNWRAQFAGMHNWHRLGVLDEDAEYKQLAIDLDHMALPDLRNVTESRICMAFGVPPILVGANVGLQRSTFSNYEEARTSFWDETLAPEYKRIVAALSRGLAPEFPGGGVIEADTSEVAALQDDQDKLSTRILSQWKEGLITRDEARERLGYDPIGKGRGAVIRLSAGIAEVDPAEETPSLDTDSYAKRVNAAAMLIRSGFEPGASLATSGLPEIAHTGLLPVTVQSEEQLEPDPAQPQPPALPAPEKALTLPERKALTPREQAHLDALARVREGAEPKFEAAVTRYFRDLLNRVDGIIGRSLDRAGGTAKEEEPAAPPPFSAEQLVPAEADAALQAALRQLWIALIVETWDAINTAGLIGAVPYEGGTPPVQRILLEGATRVVGINDATRDGLRRALQEGVARGYSIQQIANGVPGDGFPGIRSLVVELYKNRAVNIARTETATAQNAAAAARYAASGVEHVTVMDGDEDEPCAAVNGTRQTVAWLSANPIAHPQCTRAGVPIVEGL